MNLESTLKIKIDNNLFKKLKWLPFPKYVECQKAVTVYKSLKNELNSHYVN